MKSLLRKSGLSCVDAEDGHAGPLELTWDYDECTMYSASAFNRLSKLVIRHRAANVILDMSGCDYMSVSGLNLLIDWCNDLYAGGVDLKLTGVSPLIKKLFDVSNLQWLLEDEKAGNV